MYVGAEPYSHHTTLSCCMRAECHNTAGRRRCVSPGPISSKPAPPASRACPWVVPCSVQKLAPRKFAAMPACSHHDSYYSPHSGTGPLATHSAPHTGCTASHALMHTTTRPHACWGRAILSPHHSCMLHARRVSQHSRLPPLRFPGANFLQTCTSCQQGMPLGGPLLSSQFGPGKVRSRAPGLP